MFLLKIITPTKKVSEEHVYSVTVPGAEGELTVLTKHEQMMALLKEGIITILKEEGGEEEYLAIGGGYVETDGKEVTILVTKAYRQDEIDEKLAEKAKKDAEELLEKTKDRTERAEALASIRRSNLDLKLLHKYRKKKV